MDLSQLLTSTLSRLDGQPPTLEQLEMVRNILQEDRMAKEAEAQTRRDEIRLKELELALASASASDYRQPPSDGNDYPVVPGAPRQPAFAQTSPVRVPYHVTPSTVLPLDLPQQPQQMTSSFPSQQLPSQLPHADVPVAGFYDTLPAPTSWAPESHLASGFDGLGLPSTSPSYPSLPALTSLTIAEEDLNLVHAQPSSMADALDAFLESEAVNCSQSDWDPGQYLESDRLALVDCLPYLTRGTPPAGLPAFLMQRSDIATTSLCHAPCASPAQQSPLPVSPRQPVSPGPAQGESSASLSSAPPVRTATAVAVASPPRPTSNISTVATRSGPRSVVAPPASRQFLSKRPLPAQVQIMCRHCSQAVAQAQLHSLTPTDAAPYIPDYACAVCADSRAWASTKRSKRAATIRKRNAEMPPCHTPISCDVCKKVTAAGGFRLPYADGTEPALEDIPTLWEAPDFRIELICVSCREKYALCSDCGGGGKYRTGKWRPIQMFASGRATCSLSHKRYSNAVTSVGTWHIHHPQYPYPEGWADIPEDCRKPTPNWALLRGIKMCIATVFGMCFGVPASMESNELIQTWSKLSEQANEVVGDVAKELDGIGQKARPPFLGKAYNGNPGLNWTYVALRWIQPHAVASTGPGQDSGIAASQERMEEDDPDSLWDDLTEHNLRERLPRVTAFGLVDWHLATGVIMDTIGAATGRHNQPAARHPLEELVQRILDDHTLIVAYATPGIIVPPRPRWLCVTEMQFDDKPFTDRWWKRGFSLLEDNPECPWTVDMEMENSQNFPAGVKRIVCMVADVEEFLTIHRAAEAEDALPKSRKRLLKK
ncbi:hypothetical protein HKX48_004536 [Thoreauomyces humboldtii]|nr:hypothetical protein HKX48_004536 [Thoreauomyces humboldtii]